MDGDAATVYQPGTKFVEEKKDPLIDLELTDSNELWLIQWPINQAPDFNGQRVSLKLHGDGHVATFECSSGKLYEMFSMKSQGPQETVFLNSESEAKIAGKISRHISLIHYPEPSELQKRNNLNRNRLHRSSMTTSTASGHRLATPSRSSKSKSSQPYSTPSSRTKSIVTGMPEPSKGSKRKRVEDDAGSVDHSGKTQSAVTSTGSMEQEIKTKKKKKTEN